MGKIDMCRSIGYVLRVSILEWGVIFVLVGFVYQLQFKCVNWASFFRFGP